MTYEEIVKEAKASLCGKDAKEIDGHLAVQIDVIGEGEGAFYVEVKDGEVFVEPYEYYDRDCKLIATADVFTKLISGKLDAVLAYTTGKLRVEGDLGKALEFQKLTKAAAKEKKAAAKESKAAAKAKKK